MKIYVDELPKNCAECPLKSMERFEDSDGETVCIYECSLEQGEHKEEWKGLEFSVLECPLQSLAEHDAEIRKQESAKAFNLFEEMRNELTLCQAKIDYDTFYQRIIPTLLDLEKRLRKEKRDDTDK